MKNAISLNISKLTDYQLEKVVKKLNKICFNKGWKLTGYTSENGNRATAIKLEEFLNL